MKPGPIMILTALRVEAAAIAAALKLARGKRLHWSGQIEGRAVELRVIGPSAALAPPEDLLATASAIIVAGLGGALDPALHPGDTVIDGDIDPGSLPPRARRGRIHTVDLIADTRGAKARIRAETGADVVDMEQSRIAALGGPKAAVIGIRTVLDTADEMLPAWMSDLVGPSGRPRTVLAAASLLRRPGRLPTLLWAGRRTRRVLPELARSVQAVARAVARSRAQSPVG